MRTLRAARSRWMQPSAAMKAMPADTSRPASRQMWAGSVWGWDWDFRNEATSHWHSSVTMMGWAPCEHIPISLTMLGWLSPAIIVASRVRSTTPPRSSCEQTLAATVMVVVVPAGGDWSTTAGGGGDPAAWVTSDARYTTPNAPRPRGLRRLRCFRKMEVGVRAVGVDAMSRSTPAEGSPLALGSPCPRLPLPTPPEEDAVKQTSGMSSSPLDAASGVRRDCDCCR